VLTSTKERISDFAAKTTKVVPTGTLMMSFKLSIGKLAFAGCDLYTNEAIAAFHLHEPSDVDSDFLYWALSIVDWTALTKGSEKVKGATMNKAKLNLLEIPMPPLEEQKRIVALLDAATACVTELTECYEQERTHANNLFTSALRDALESNPDWPVKTIGEICQVVNGATPKTNVEEYWGGGHAWITPAEMGNLDSPFLSMSRRTISDQGLAACSATFKRMTRSASLQRTVLHMRLKMVLR
jgi:type I restriction enzyme S subunit